MTSPLFKTRRIPTWAAVLSSVLVVTFVGLAGNDIHCKYQYLVQRGHHESGPQAQAMDMSHCLYAHQAASTVMPSLGVSDLDILDVVGVSDGWSPLVRAFELVLTLAARAPPVL